MKLFPWPVTNPKMTRAFPVASYQLVLRERPVQGRGHVRVSVRGYSRRYCFSSSRLYAQRSIAGASATCVVKG